MPSLRSPDLILATANRWRALISRGNWPDITPITSSSPLFDRGAHSGKSYSRSSSQRSQYFCSARPWSQRVPFRMISIAFSCSPNVLYRSARSRRSWRPKPPPSILRLLSGAAPAGYIFWYCSKACLNKSAQPRRSESSMRIGWSWRRTLISWGTRLRMAKKALRAYAKVWKVEQQAGNNHSYSLEFTHVLGQNGPLPKSVYISRIEAINFSVAV